MARFLALAAVVACALVGAAAAPAAFPPVAWCGTDAVAVDRDDAVPALAWHVVYAFPADGADGFAAVAGGIVTDLAAIDAWWRVQDATRAPRFDLAAFPGCASPFGQIDLSRVQLPQPGSAYQDSAVAFTRIVADLNAAGFVSADKKYLVYYDGPFADPKHCGQGNVGLVDGGRDAFAVVFMGACANTVGTGELSGAITAAHEMVHAYNALAFPRPDPPVPNECPQDEWKGHVCDSTDDLMYPEAQETDTLATRRLDVNGDDYYGHGGSWWDVRDSRYLQRLDSADVTPPSGPDSLSVTSTGSVVNLTWPAATDESAIRYRVYRDGDLVLPLASRRSRQLQGKPGRTLVVGVRAVDPSGLLGPLVSVRFRVGYGVVDETGALLSDTVAPPGVRFRSARIGPSGLALRWRAVRDLAGPLRGYLVERNGKPFREVLGTTVTIARAQAAGRWSIRAIDGAGNLSPRVQRVRVG